MNSMLAEYGRVFGQDELGEEALPALIYHMDDRRALPERHMVLRNLWPDALEGYRQYEPELVVDALAALLNQLVGENFGLSYNTATTQERDHEVAAWRVFLHYWENGKVSHGP